MKRKPLIKADITAMQNIFKIPGNIPTVDREIRFIGIYPADQYIKQWQHLDLYKGDKKVEGIIATHYDIPDNSFDDHHQLIQSTLHQRFSDAKERLLIQILTAILDREPVADDFKKMVLVSSTDWPERVEVQYEDKVLGRITVICNEYMQPQTLKFTPPPYVENIKVNMGFNLPETPAGD